ncbi:MobF family relaxase [uncultured Roseobacter sp.]|uniref:MobF family relaxase n=1 Tax=uncultured Roseobacter sp. TaxID=114847 RepID=UPI002614A706|nr:MobF family relaxase [uncultured Roseobacter sp.]
MLSMSNVSSGQASSGYYKAEGYYIAGSPEAEQAARYFGDAAAEAGLSGRIDDVRFSQLLDGMAPDGSRIGRMRDGAWEHRSGIDLTFSAPKGVSIAALVGGDSRVLEAHHEAVNEAMGYVEKHVVQTRIWEEGQMTVVTGGKIIAGLFQHDTSRALDPQLHTHAVIANMVDPGDGRFRSLHNDNIYRHTLLLGQIYRNALAGSLEKLGYSVEWGDKGLFDIRDVPEPLIEHFSKRRSEIEASLKDRNLEPSTRNSALAALATRSKKGPVERGDLYSAWRSEAQSQGITLQMPKEPAQERTQLSDARAALQFAVSHLSERQSIYEKADVIQTAITHDKGVRAVEVEREIRDALGRRDLFAVMHDDRAHLTDKETARVERENIGLMRRERRNGSVDVRSATDKLTLRPAEKVVARRLDRTTLTDGQKEAAHLILTSEDRIVGVQGLAGTGKTFMLATVAKQLERAEYTIEGLAPSLKAVSALSESVPDSRTVSSALVRHENAPGDPDKSKTVLVVDEASMLSSRQMNSVIKMANDKGYARVVLVGDVRQLDAVAAGSSFRQLQDAGMPYAQMLDIQRQNTAEGRTAVLHAYRGDVHAAFSGISEVSETEDNRAAISAEVASKYLSRSSEDRARTGIVVMTNGMRRDINSAVQAGLRRTGEVTGQAVTINSLLPRNLTVAEAGEASSFKTGNIIAALKTVKTADLTAGALYEVSAVDPEKRLLELTDEEGKSRVLTLEAGSRLGRHLVAFQKTHEQFAVGDAVKFKITDRDNGIENANSGRIVSINQKQLTVRTEDGNKTLRTDSLAARGMQLAYASTSHDYQGSTVDRVILGMHSKERLATQKGFYVSLSRMREDTLLVTDSASKLADTIQKETGERINALEALSQNPQAFQERLHDQLLDRGQAAFQAAVQPGRMADFDPFRFHQNAAPEPEKTSPHTTLNQTSEHRTEDAHRGDRVRTEEQSASQTERPQGELFGQPDGRQEDAKSDQRQVQDAARETASERQSEAPDKASNDLQKDGKNHPGRDREPDPLADLDQRMNDLFDQLEEKNLDQKTL